MEAQAARLKPAGRRWRHALESRRVLAPLLIAPAIVFMVLVVGVPFVWAIYLSFTDAIGGSLSGNWVGFANFTDAWHDDNFRRALRNTLIFTFASHPGRVRRLTNRIEGVALAEAGGNFLDVYRHFQQEGYTPRESYQHSMRIFRGSLPAGCGPFTKDLCYSKGFVLVYNFIRLAVSRGMVGRVPLLFCGKTNLADVKTLAQLVDEGLVVPPRYVPPQFADLHALSAWMCFANFLGRLSLKRIEEDYAGLF